MRSYTIVRSIDISAPLGRVRALVADFREWTKWSPWEDRDSSIRREYSGPRIGEGSYFAWWGNRSVGQGNMMIGSSTPAVIEIRLVFIKPRRANNPMSFHFEATDAGTRVTWAMRGRCRGVACLLPRVLRPEQALRADFGRGLARLKNAAESAG